MLFLSDSQYAERQRIFDQVDSGELSEEAACHRELEIDPHDHHALGVLGSILVDKGELEEGLRYLWAALEAQPCESDCYVRLSRALSAAGEDDLVRGISSLGSYRLLQDPERGPQFEARLKKALQGPKKKRGGFARFLTREAVEVLAFEDAGDTEEVAATLRPYRAVQSVIDWPGEGLDDDDIREIKDAGGRCPDLLIGVVRAWARQDTAVFSIDSAIGALALVGEIGASSHLPALLECVGVEDPNVDEAACWATHRLAERHPDIASQVAGVPRAEPGLEVSDFCGPADPDISGIPSPPPVAHRAVQRPGRNDPCWCGSGKKYKKCHLNSDQEIERGARAPDDAVASVYEPTIGRVLEFVQQTLPRKEFNSAIRLFYPDSGIPPETGRAVVPFLDWLIHDYEMRQTRRTPISEYLARNADKLTAAEQRNLEEHAQSRHSLFEVTSIEPGVGVELEDLLIGDTFFVHDVSTSHHAVTWDNLLCRIRPEGDRTVMTGDGLTVPRHLGGLLREWIVADRERSRLDWPTYLVANSHVLRHQVQRLYRDWRDNLQLTNQDGDPLEISKAVLQVAKPASVARKLAASDVFRDATTESEHTEFVWTGESERGKDDYLVRGRLSLSGNRVEVECNSRKRLDQTLEALRAALGDSFEVLKRDYKQLGDLTGPGNEPAPAGETPEMPPEVKADLMSKYLEQHYATWPDTPLPALNGLTPREAARDPDSRELLADLLKLVENGELRKKKRGEPWYDFSKVRAELGIE